MKSMKDMKKGNSNRQKWRLTQSFMLFMSFMLFLFIVDLPLSRDMAD